MGNFFHKLAKTELILSLLGLILFLGYVGFGVYQKSSTPSSPSNPPTIQK